MKLTTCSKQNYLAVILIDQMSFVRQQMNSEKSLFFFLKKSLILSPPPRLRARDMLFSPGGILVTPFFLTVLFLSIFQRRRRDTKTQGNLGG